jgi:putative selenate reductase FAD-binding subunit
MIVEYHRPKTVEEALKLLSHTDIVTVPLGGGTAIRRTLSDPIAVVDLQELKLNTVQRRGNILEVGATVTLQTLLDTPDLPVALYKAIRHEAAYNIRQVATVVGTLVASDGRSPFATTLLALDTQLSIISKDETQHLPLDLDNELISLDDLFPLRKELLKGRLVTQVQLPLHVRLAYEYVARTPADHPIVCVALAQWPAGRTRVALGGYGQAPVVIMDGPEAEGAKAVAQNAYSHAVDDWASAEYRQEVVGVLTRRCLDTLRAEGL